MIAEAALAHVAGDATERAYRRGDALEKRVNVSGRGDDSPSLIEPIEEKAYRLISV